MNNTIHGPFPSVSTGGRRFTQKPTSYWCGPITQITIYGNDNTIFGLQVIYQQYTPPLIGSNTGTPTTFEIPTTERVTTINVGFEHSGVTYLKFTMSNGNTYNSGNSSVHHQQEILIEESQELYYFLGRKGAAIDQLSIVLGDIMPLVELQTSAGPHPADSNGTTSTSSIAEQGFAETNLKSINVYYADSTVSWITGIELVFSGDYSYSVGLTSGTGISSKSFELAEGDAINEVYIQWADTSR